jgi:hypothetical protein
VTAFRLAEGSAGAGKRAPVSFALLLSLVALFSGVTLAMAGAAEPDKRSGPAGVNAREIVVFRTMMPDASPSAFAIGLPGGLGLCYDVGRGGINYMWQGDFPDLGPTWKAKINKPAMIAGDIIYREPQEPVLRLNGAAGRPDFHFKGYRYLPGAIEFNYVLDGIAVREEIRAAPGGLGVVRHFRLAAPARWTFAAPSTKGMRLSSEQGRWDEQHRMLTGLDQQEFTLQMNLSVEGGR